MDLRVHGAKRGENEGDGGRDYETEDHFPRLNIQSVSHRRGEGETGRSHLDGPDLSSCVRGSLKVVGSSFLRGPSPRSAV